MWQAQIHKGGKFAFADVACCKICCRGRKHLCCGQGLSSAPIAPCDRDAKDMGARGEQLQCWGFGTKSDGSIGQGPFIGRPFEVDLFCHHRHGITALILRQINFGTGLGKDVNFVDGLGDARLCFSSQSHGNRDSVLPRAVVRPLHFACG